KKSMRKISLALVLVVANIFVVACGQATPDQTQTNQETQKNQYAKTKPVALLSIEASDEERGLFNMQVQNMSDKMIASFSWTVVLYDASGKVLGTQDSSFEDSQYGLSPSQAVQGSFVSNYKDAVKAKVVFKDAVLFVDFKVGTTKNWVNEDYNKELQELLKG
ncbi:MAG TPA: hypothetical protein PK835_01740, partial [Caldisericia bacterium]|nr:hypothetical protein [Caldisericia bacterium]HQG60138.1 hypothetical protein [Caldisericia bacterium]HQJ44263.1 hypothetical protein [Caldisericia bacterium]